MSLFSRRRSKNPTPSDQDTTPDLEPGVTEDSPTPPDSPETQADDAGPWDSSQVTSRGNRVDLGALWLPLSPGFTLRVEVDKSGRVIAANVARDGSTLRLLAFAAPKTAGLWEDLRVELAEAIEKSGGQAEQVDGPFGPELRAKVPAKTRDGRTGKKSVRYVGLDGPRWFLRAELTGKAATNPQAAGDLEGVLRDVVVNRGSEARPPRDPLPLTMPGSHKTAPTPQAGGRKPPTMPGRGPEIAEVR